MTSSNAHAKTIIIVSHVVPVPPSAGNELRILRMMTWLKGQGYRLVLLLNHAPLPRWSIEALETVVDEVHLIDDFLLSPRDGVVRVQSRMVKRLLSWQRFLG